MFWKKKKAKNIETKNVIISLDNYSDVFSDFDPRPYNVKAISSDLISELDRVDPELSYDKYHVIFVIPKEQRILKDEIIIKKRLSEFFNKEYLTHKAHQNKIIKQGSLFISLGVVVIFLFFYLLPKYPYLLSTFSFIQIIFELVGWFLLWEGLNLIVFDSKEKQSDIKFYKLVSDAKFTFVNDKHIDGERKSIWINL